MKGNEYNIYPGIVKEDNIMGSSMKNTYKGPMIGRSINIVFTSFIDLLVW
jgi:hypothetical protein